MKLYEINRDARFFVLQFEKTTFDYEDGYGAMRKATIPNENIFVQLVMPNYNKSCGVYYLVVKNGLPSWTEVRLPNNTEVKLLTSGKVFDAILEDYTKIAINNLQRELDHAWMIGSDPEVFVQDGKGNMLPAFLFLGSKANTKQRSPTTTVIYGGHKLYWDGYQAEFETGAQHCLGYHVDSIYAGLQGVYNEARKHDPNAKLLGKTVVDVSTDMLNEARDEHVEFGCMPSFNAYGMKGAQVPGRLVPFRPAGGHIHFGIGKANEETIHKMVKALDAITGVMCVSLFEGHEDNRRRELYGLPGEYRLPPHGMEYRALSNAWLFHPFLTNLVFDIARKSVIFGQKGFMKYWEGSEEETIEVMMTNDVKKARNILTRNKKTMLGIIDAVYKSRFCVDAQPIFDGIMKGMNEIIKDPTDMTTNWNLDGGWQGHSDGANKNVHLAYNCLKEGKKFT